ncbi:hypothetical protein ACFWQC_19665 [Nocardioides sp. NPDC058538]|uniref:hypothetical protein n=1 Tax=Nocardioides sp. NPDC058538 TaxID=3346542 RepID=UPI003646DDCA
MARNPTSATFAVTFPQRRQLGEVFEDPDVEPVDVELLAAAHFSAAQLLAGSAFASQTLAEDGLGAARRAPGLLGVVRGGSAAIRGAGGGGGLHDGGGPVGPFGGSALRCSIAPPDLGN